MRGKGTGTLCKGSPERAQRAVRTRETMEREIWDKGHFAFDLFGGRAHAELVGLVLAMYWACEKTPLKV